MDMITKLQKNWAGKLQVKYWIEGKFKPTLGPLFRTPDLVTVPDRILTLILQFYTQTLHRYTPLGNQTNVFAYIVDLSVSIISL